MCRFAMMCITLRVVECDFGSWKNGLRVVLMFFLATSLFGQGRVKQCLCFLFISIYRNKTLVSWQYCDLYYYKGPRWQSGNTLASHLWDRGSNPGPTSSGKAGSCLLLVSKFTVQNTWHTECMYWFPPPTKLPVVIWYSVESNVKPQINK